MCCSAAAAVPSHQAQLSLATATRQTHDPSIRIAMLMLFVIVCDLATTISAMRMSGVFSQFEVATGIGVGFI